MAVLVEFEVPGATPEQMYALEARTRERGEALGRPPFVGCMFLAVTANERGFRFVSAWRTEAAFREAMDTMLAPDLHALSTEASEVTVSAVISMAIPGTAAP